MADEPAIRCATHDDLAFLRRMLFEAWLWDAERERPDFDELLATEADPLDPYIVDFGSREGDVGFVAVRRGQSIGPTWYRLFSIKSARRGFIAEDVPELALAVEGSARGEGVGRRLMEALIARALQDGRPALSLDVHLRNGRARKLYES